MDHTSVPYAECHQGHMFFLIKLECKILVKDMGESYF
jgi:hypothetical protein